MSMWKINRQETEATSTNLVNINNKKVEFITKNNQIFCTSLDIARVFEKRHTHILDIIKNYLNDEDMKEFNQPNFRLVNYKDLKGELRPAYEVSRDGFSFIAMGLTGKKANKWKISFINAFNKMEQVITQEIHSPNKYLTEIMSELYKRLPQEDFSVDITLKDRNQNNQTIYSHHYEVGGKPRDPKLQNKESRLLVEASSVKTAPTRSDHYASKSNDLPKCENTPSTTANAIIPQQDKSAKDFKSKLKEFNTKNNANKTIKNKDLEK
ncbi:Rha family transcriptional regulator [Campylobacter upsaliensis]